MELPGPYSEAFKISWKTPKQVSPYERPSPEQWLKALSPRGPDRPKVWSRCSLTGPRPRLPCSCKPQTISTGYPPNTVCARKLGYFFPPGLGDPSCVLMGGHSISGPSLLRASLSCCFHLFSEPSPVHRPPAERTAFPSPRPHSSGFPGWGGGGEPLWDAKHQTSQAWGFRPLRH